MTNPAAVSRTLKRAGFLMTSPEAPISQPGARVTRGALAGRVVVQIETGLASRDRRLSGQMTTALAAAGYQTETEDVVDLGQHLYSRIEVWR